MGHLAEIIACIILTLKGYRILKRRFKTPLGEIDLIASKEKTLILLEVKSRKTIQKALESLTEHQKKRINQAAKFVLNDRMMSGKDHVRFDFFALSYLRWKHIKNAWI